MSLYEYECPECGRRIEAQNPMVWRDARPPICSCAIPFLMRRVISVPAIRGDTVSRP